MLNGFVEGWFASGHGYRFCTGLQRFWFHGCHLINAKFRTKRDKALVRPIPLLCPFPFSQNSLLTFLPAVSRSPINRNLSKTGRRASRISDLANRFHLFCTF